MPVWLERLVIFAMVLPIAAALFLLPDLVDAVMGGLGAAIRAYFVGD